MAYSVGLEGRNWFFILLLCGDVDLNPGPTNQQKNSKSIKANETHGRSESLLLFEKKIECGQESNGKSL